MFFKDFPRPTRGALFVVSGPSGVGKSTLLKRALERIPDLSFSVSATTRAPREGERDGVDYHFLSDEGFAAKRADGAFLEHATVYGRSYGTLRAPVERELDAGRSILLDIDVQGARAVREAMPEAVLVMIAPPDVGTLERRLRSRNTDSDEVIARRMRGVAEQLGAVAEYDFVVINDDLTTAHASLQAVLLGELCRVSRHSDRVARIGEQVASLA